MGHQGNADHLRRAGGPCGKNNRLQYVYDVGRKVDDKIATFSGRPKLGSAERQSWERAGGSSDTGVWFALVPDNTVTMAVRAVRQAGSQCGQSRRRRLLETGQEGPAVRLVLRSTVTLSGGDRRCP